MKHISDRHQIFSFSDDWVLCHKCKQWYHESCAGGRGKKRVACKMFLVWRRYVKRSYSVRILCLIISYYAQESVKNVLSNIPYYRVFWTLLLLWSFLLVSGKLWSFLLTFHYKSTLRYMRHGIINSFGVHSYLRAVKLNFSRKVSNWPQSTLLQLASVEFHA